MSRLSLIAADLIVVVVTWRKTFRHCREAAKIGLRSVSSVLLRDGAWFTMHPTSKLHLNFFFVIRKHLFRVSSLIYAVVVNGVVKLKYLRGSVLLVLNIAHLLNGIVVRYLESGCTTTPAYQSCMSSSGGRPQTSFHMSIFRALTTCKMYISGCSLSGSGTG